MAPGVFLVWSRVNSEQDAQFHNDAVSFDNSILSFEGVSRGCRYKIADLQPMPEPYKHDVPFLTIYDLSNVEHQKEKDYQRLQEHIRQKEKDAFPPRVYEEVERLEAEGCENIHPGIGDLIGVVTNESPPKDSEDEFWSFHRDVFVESLKQGPHFLRARVLKWKDAPMAGEREFPSSPYLSIYEWDSDEMPWNELMIAAQKKGWQKHIESGLTWQVMHYHPQKYSKEKDVVKKS